MVARGREFTCLFYNVQSCHEEMPCIMKYTNKYYRDGVDTMHRFVASFLNDWRLPYIVAIVSILFSSAGQVWLKMLMQNSSIGTALLFNPLFYTGFGAYAASALLWLWVLARLPLAVAYPLVGLNFVFIGLASVLFLHEHFSWHVLMGTILVVCGVLVVNYR